VCGYFGGECGELGMRNYGLCGKACVFGINVGLTIDKKGETFDVIKILSNGKSVEPSTHPLGKLEVFTMY
jgi:hypothetical protein